MLQTEKSTDKNLVGLQPKEPFHKQYLRVEDGPRRVRQGWPNFYDLKFGPEPEKLGVRGGWLCDEMGMGKTCVCTALILANPFDPDAKPDVKPTLSGVGASASGGKRSKLTVVVCPNTLVLQWHDEVAKFGPRLKVAMLYNSHKAKALRELKSLDVLITTPHMGIPDYLGGRIHRLILDESHLYEHGSGDSMSGKRDHLLQWNPSTIWCVTGTPFATGLNQLTGQSKMMGMWYDGPKIKELTESYPRMKNEKVVEKLRSLMIRHTKSQHIAGAVALSLPDTDSKTVELELSEDEKALYAYASCSDGVPEWATAEYSIKGQNARLATLSGLTRRLMAAACLHISPEDDVEARRLAVECNLPTMIEGMSYRINSHSTSDDDSKYRRSEPPQPGYEDERAYWEARSPILRFGKYLQNLGWWDLDHEKELRAYERQHAIKALNDAEQLPNPHIKHLFTDVFDEPNQILLKQAAELQDHLSRYREHYPDIPAEQITDWDGRY